MLKKTAILILPFALLSLLLGMIAGLQRINWSIPFENIAADHGALMTGSFIGTLICLERSITHINKWWRMLPFISGLSMILFLVKQPMAAYCLLILASLGLLVLMATFFRESANLSNALLVMGAFAWLTGNLVLFNQHSYPAAVKWWMAFYLWTIFGERLELSRLLPFNRVKKISLWIILAVNITGVLLPFHWYGNELFAISLIGVSIWLLIYDMSRFAVKFPGQHRYIGIWLIMAYAWLMMAGMQFLFWSDKPFSYDAALHSFFLGFVFSAIIGHAPIIFPGVFKINISLYHPLFYVIFFGFHCSLVVRMIGDVIQENDFRKWGAMINGVSIVLFLLFNATIISVRLRKLKQNVRVKRQSLAGIEGSL